MPTVFPFGMPTLTPEQYNYLAQERAAIGNGLRDFRAGVTMGLSPWGAVQFGMGGYRDRPRYYTDAYGRPTVSGSVNTEPRQAIGGPYYDYQYDATPGMGYMATPTPTMPPSQLLDSMNGWYPYKIDPYDEQQGGYDLYSGELLPPRDAEKL